MNHVTAISRPRVLGRAEVVLKQWADEKDPAYMLDLGLYYAEVFFLAKDSSSQKAQP